MEKQKTRRKHGGFFAFGFFHQKLKTPEKSPHSRAEKHKDYERIFAAFGRAQCGKIRSVSGNSTHRSGGSRRTYIHCCSDVIYLEEFK